MRVLQKNKGCNSYIEISGVEIKDNYERRMFMYAPSDWLVKADYRFIDNEESMLFRIDGMSVLSEKYRRVNPGIEDVRALIRNLGACLSELSEYMLDPEDLVISMRSILYDSRLERYKFLYVPGSGGGFIRQIKEVMEDIMVIFDNRDRSGTTELYEIYSRLLEDNFSPEMFMMLMQEKEKTAEDESAERKTYEGRLMRTVSGEDTKLRSKDSERRNKGIEENNWQFNNNERQTSRDEEKADIKKILLYGAVIAVLGVAAMALLGAKGAILSLLMLGGYTVYAINDFLEKKQVREIEDAMSEVAGVVEVFQQEKSSEELKLPMVVTGSAFKEVNSLIPFAGENEEPIRLMEDGEITIGRQAGACQYCLSEPGISRVHAVLRKEGRKVMLRDEASTNGTYVNNRRLRQDAEELKYGDVVSFAGVEYYCV